MDAESPGRRTGAVIYKAVEPLLIALCRHLYINKLFPLESQPDLNKSHIIISSHEHNVKYLNYPRRRIIKMQISSYYQYVLK